MRGRQDPQVGMLAFIDIESRIPLDHPPGSNILRFDLEEIVAWTKARINK